MGLQDVAACPPELVFVASLHDAVIMALAVEKKAIRLGHCLQ